MHSLQGDTPLPFVCGKNLELELERLLAMDVMVTNLDYIIQETGAQQKFLSNHFRISSCHLNLMCILRGRFLNENFHFIVLVNTCFVIYLQFTFFSRILSFWPEKDQKYFVVCGLSPFFQLLPAFWKGSPKTRLVPSM